ncbi:MAG: hypothetical protein HQL54_07560 [Magnetococcales bacterium]|nr:hypothetical protein [Magnetococcales bacterium]
MNKPKKERKKKRKPFGVVKQHHVELKEGQPVAIRLELSNDYIVELDYITREIRLIQGEALSAKQEAWCVQIGQYLGRMALMEKQEEAQKNALGAAKPLEFGVRPDPNQIWWG